jgi:hypothetical protein
MSLPKYVLIMFVSIRVMSSSRGWWNGPAGLIGPRGKRKGEKKRELGRLGEKRERERERKELGQAESFFLDKDVAKLTPLKENLILEIREDWRIIEGTLP